MVVTIVSPLKELLKATFPKKEMRNGDSKDNPIDLEKKSQAPMKSKSCNEYVCIAYMMFALLVLVGICVIFYLLTDHFVLQRTIQGGQKYEVGFCLCFPKGKLPDGEFFMICFPTPGNSTISPDMTSEKSDLMRNIFGREKLN